LKITYCGQLKLYQQIAFEGFKQIAAIILLCLEHESDKNDYFSKITIIFMYLLNFLPWKVPFVFFKEMTKKI